MDRNKQQTIPTGKTVICVPSYKNRYDHIVGNLKNIDPCYDIVVFLQEGDYVFQPDSKEMYKDAMMRQFQAHVGMYLKYRDGISLVFNKNGLLTMRCNLPKYWNTMDVPVRYDAYHEGLYEVCKTRDTEAIKNYIINNKK